MVDGLNDHVIDGVGAFFDEKFRWMGNAGCGTKIGLKAFQDNWQRPFQAAFSDKVCIDEARIAEGEWMAASGSQQATHSGEFMGIAPTGRPVEIRYMDFWRVQDGKIVDNWVMVDFPTCCANWASMCSTVRVGRLTTRAGAGPRVRPRPVDRGHSTQRDIPSGRHGHSRAASRGGLETTHARYS